MVVDPLNMDQRRDRRSAALRRAGSSRGPTSPPDPGSVGPQNRFLVLVLVHTRPPPPHDQHTAQRNGLYRLGPTSTSRRPNDARAAQSYRQSRDRMTPQTSRPISARSSPGGRHVNITV